MFVGRLPLLVPVEACLIQATAFLSESRREAFLKDFFLRLIMRTEVQL